MTITVAAFYHFFPLTEPVTRKAPLLAFMEARGIHGTILLAEEGFNGTVSGDEKAVGELIQYLRDLAGGSFDVKLSRYAENPFGQIKVKVKKEIVTSGMGVSPVTHKTGTHVPPKDWNALIARDDVTLIDARNAYEMHLGKFKGAVDPATRKFRQLPAFTKEHFPAEKTRKIATYCTGGIRCEKYTAWLLDQGYEEVYHLEGGILNYLAEIPESESLWEGSCYVFDERVAVGHGCTPSPGIDYCRACGHPLKPEDKTQDFIPGEHCRFCDSYPPSNL